MKNKTLQLSFLLAVLLLMMSCSKSEPIIDVQSVELNTTKLTLTEGESKTLTATLIPENATNRNLSWSSSNKTYATVDQNGMVTAIKPGKVDIRVTSEDGNKRATCELTIEYDMPYQDKQYKKVMTATKGKQEVDIIFTGDGFTVEDIQNGDFDKAIDEAIDHFFDIEPYRTYKDYFSVYVIYAFSKDSGISDENNDKNTAFSTKYDEPEPSTLMSIDYDVCFEYASAIPHINFDTEPTIVVVTNSTRYAGTAWLWTNNAAIAIASRSKLHYPYDFRGIVQHEASGHAFGKLADEYYENTTISSSERQDIIEMHQLMHYHNIDVTDDPETILWKHFFNEPKYKYVSIIQGGNYHKYGVWRPEEMTLMLNNVPYINAPGREVIVKRIMRLAGETYSFESFKANDVKEQFTPTRFQFTFDESKRLPPPRIIKVK